MQISRRGALFGAGAAAVVAGVPGTVQGKDAEATDKLATAEDYLATSFEAVHDLKLPTWDEWDEWMRGEFPDVVLGCATLRFSNTELAEVVRKMGGVQGIAGELYEALNSMEESHRGVADYLKMIQARLLVAMTQAYRKEVGLVQFKLELGAA